MGLKLPLFSIIYSNPCIHIRVSMYIFISTGYNNTLSPIALYKNKLPGDIVSRTTWNLPIVLESSLFFVQVCVYENFKLMQATRANGHVVRRAIQFLEVRLHPSVYVWCVRPLEKVNMTILELNSNRVFSPTFPANTTGRT